MNFARCATGKRRIVYCDQAFHSLIVGSLSLNGAEDWCVLEQVTRKIKKK
jgi:4-aminobutyrate aminotransferase-like enzyme